MDRKGGEQAVDCAAMFAGGVVALELLLRAGGAGERGEFAVDASNRRALSGTTVLRVTADDRMARGAGSSSEPQASGIFSLKFHVQRRTARRFTRPQIFRKLDRPQSYPVVAANDFRELPDS